MNFKKIIFRFLLLALLFYFTINVVKIAHINDTLFTWLWIAGGVALVNLFTRNILKFFTIRSTFITIFLATIILTTAILYFLDLFIPGFDVKAGVIGPVNLDVVLINSIKVNEITAKLFVGAIYAIIVSIMDTLNTGTRDED